MEFRILHLYYDIMNLYGEYGNVSALERYLRMQGAGVTIDRLTVGDAPDFCSYDLVYTGSGTERKQLFVLEDIKQHTESIKNALESGVIFLATGNSFELFGKSVPSADGAVHEGLSLFDFTVSLGEKRILGDVIYRSGISEKPFVGFINRASEIYGVKHPLFTVVHGIGNSERDKSEGICEGSFYGTHLTGPCIVKNPHMAEYFVRLLTSRRSADYSPIRFGNEEKAYRTTLEALTDRFEGKQNRS